MSFPLKTREELEKFDNLCIEYGKQVGILTTDCPALRLLYDKLLEDKFDERFLWRLISLVFDIKIGYIHTFFDVSVVAGIENEYIVPENKRKDFQPFEDINSFAIAFRKLRSIYGLITRTRALWEKLFIYIGAIELGEDYIGIIMNAKSPRSYFFKNFSDGIGLLKGEDILKIMDSIELLDSKFRTPELHGFGSVRTWAFDSSNDWPINETSTLIGHWSLINHYLHLIFKECSSPVDSFSQT